MITSTPDFLENYDFSMSRTVQIERLIKHPVKLLSTGFEEKEALSLKLIESMRSFARRSQRAMPEGPDLTPRRGGKVMRILILLRLMDYCDFY